MSLLGVLKINDMTDCTKVLPAPVTNFPGVPGGNTTRPPTSSTTTATRPSSTSYHTYSPSITYTSTYYETTKYTITSCAPTVTYCAGGGSYETTEVLTLTTTWCPDDSSPESSYVPGIVFYPSYSTESSAPAQKVSATSPSLPVVTAGASSARSWLVLVAAVVGLVITVQ